VDEIPVDNIQGEIKTFLKMLQTQLQAFSEQAFTGEADSGRIRATVSSAGTVTDVSIHVLAKREHDNLTLSDLVLEAIMNARRTLEEARADIMSNSKVFGMPVGSFLSDPRGAQSQIDLID
jgi:DNA-binding protein YbaB